MNVSLAFIFRGEGMRRRIFDEVRPIVSDMYPFSNIGVYDSLHNIFSRAGSRNMAIEDNVTANVVVVCDADSIPIQDSLVQAIEGAYADRKLHIPFDKVNVIPYGKFTRNSVRYDKLRPHYSYGPSCGGIYVIRPEIWIEMGGQDERVIGWGSEDRIWYSTVRTYDRGPIYHPGTLYNINHPRDTRSAALPANLDLVAAYLAAQDNLDQLREVQRGSNRFCAYEGPPPAVG